MLREEINALNREIIKLQEKRNALYFKENINNISEYKELIEKAIENSPKSYAKDLLVACQGTDGANSETACEKIFQMPDIMFFNNFEGVFSAIESGMCDYGIIPLENSNAGSVKEVYDLMIAHNFYIVKSVRLKVDHNLLAKSGTKLSDIKEIYSHNQALSQCSEFLKTLGKDIKITPLDNTARAAELVSKSERNDIAAIASHRCEAIYGLSNIKSSIQNSDNNYTRFICIAKNLEIMPGADKTSLMVTLPHKPGALYKILEKAYALGINLIKLESRPIPSRDFEFMFYFDFETSVYSEEFPILLGELQSICEEFKYLGSYSEII